MESKGLDETFTQVDVNLLILCMLEATFSLDTAHIVVHPHLSLTLTH